MSAAQEDGGRLISVVVPVYNEADNIAACLTRLAAALETEPHEILVCYDFDADRTLPAIAAMPDRPAAVRLVKNDLGKGVAFALRRLYFNVLTVAARGAEPTAPAVRARRSRGPSRPDGTI